MGGKYHKALNHRMSITHASKSGRVGTSLVPHGVVYMFSASNKPPRNFYKVEGWNRKTLYHNRFWMHSTGGTDGCCFDGHLLSFSWSRKCVSWILQQSWFWLIFPPTLYVPWTTWWENALIPLVLVLIQIIHAPLSTFLCWFYCRKPIRNNSCYLCPLRAIYTIFKQTRRNPHKTTLE